MNELLNLPVLGFFVTLVIIALIFLGFKLFEKFMGLTDGNTTYSSLSQFHEYVQSKEGCSEIRSACGNYLGLRRIVLGFYLSLRYR
jgi:hypothetical protein